MLACEALSRHAANHAQMEIVIDPHLRRGLVNHPPIAYTQDGLWVRCSGQEPKQLYLALRGYNCPPAWSPLGRAMVAFLSPNLSDGPHHAGISVLLQQSGSSGSSRSPTFYEGQF